MVSKCTALRRLGWAVLMTTLVASLSTAPNPSTENTPAPAVSNKQEEASRFIDLSLLVAPDYPCTWPTFPAFQINHYEKIGKLSPYNSDILIMDGNTGTQLDVPTHSVTPPNSGLPNAGAFGFSNTDKIGAWQFVGEACVIDCKRFLDSTPSGRSGLITKGTVMLWEKKHRPLGPGDVVLFHSGFSDKYYKPLPEGRRYAADPVAGTAPAWPGPDPECMEYLAGRKVMTLGIDSTSMGPLPEATADKVPISATCGPARVIDVRHLLGSTAKKQWPASPEITAGEIEKYEKKHGALKAGDVVIFRSGWSDKYYAPMPQGKACMEKPLNGTMEGWPAPGPDAIRYLASKQVRCVATDGPTLGGVEPKRALMTYWALGGAWKVGGEGMVGVEFLTNLGNLPADAYFMFAAVKVRDCHGGPGRAIALY